VTLVPEIVVPIILTGPWCSLIEATSNDCPQATPSDSAIPIRIRRDISVRNFTLIHAVHAELGDLPGI
jgi:hypothetical protein